MKNQRGSILIGVLAMSLIMTVAAGGLLFVASNSGNDEQRSAEDVTLHYAAESAIYLGLRWIRYHGWTFHDAHKSETMVLTWPETDYALIDDVKVRVVLKPNGLPKRTLEATAFSDISKDTLVVGWSVDTIRTALDDPLRSKPILSNWYEYYLPAIP